MQNVSTYSSSQRPMDMVGQDLSTLEGQYTEYLVEESLQAEVQCLRTWVDAYQSGDREAAEFLREHGAALLEDIKCKLHLASRERQRIDEESPISANYEGHAASRMNEAAETALHAEAKLSEALHQDMPSAENCIISK